MKKDAQMNPVEMIEKQKGILFPPVLRELCETHGARIEERWAFDFRDGSRLALFEQEGWEPTFLEVTTPEASDCFFVQLNPSSPAYGKVWWMDHQGPARRQDRLVADSVEELFENEPTVPGEPPQLRMRPVARERLKDLRRRRIGGRSPSS